MDRLKRVLSQYGRWKELDTYVGRIEAYQLSDFSQALENAKALLEAIGKEICLCRGIMLEDTLSVNSILKKAFSVMGYSSTHMVTQISSSLATIGQQIGELRNDIGTISHGRPLDELRERNSKVDELTREFLLDSIITVACFLIRCFENEHPRIASKETAKVLYEDNADFNEFWDELYGEFPMGDYSYLASEIFYNVDYSAYIAEQKAFAESEEGDDE